MKKIWLLLFFMTLSFLFIQCTPENEEEIVECEKIEIKGQISMDEKTIITPLGTLNWEEDDRIYMITNGVNGNIALFELQSISENIVGLADFRCVFENASRPYQMIRNIYYVGDWNYVNGIAITFPIGNQTGNKDDFGRYHVAGAREVMIKMNEAEADTDYTFTRVPFTSMVSLVRLNLQDYEGKIVEFAYDGCCNTMQLAYDGVVEYNYDEQTNTYDIVGVRELYKEGRIRVTNPSDDTYLVLFPQMNLMPVTLDIIVDGTSVGGVHFPNGIEVNKMYVGTDGNPIQLNGRAFAVE